MIPEQLIEEQLKLERDKLVLTDKLGQKAKPKHTLDEIFELSMGFLANPWNIWQNGELTVSVRSCCSDAS